VTDYPWSGKVRIRVEPEVATRFALMLRIPGWTRNETLSLNGRTIDMSRRVLGYAVVDREWKAGDEVELDLPMPVQRLYAHPDVRTDIGRVCLARGPLVYCIEEADNPEAAISRLRLPRDAQITAGKRSDLFDGIIAVAADARVAEAADWNSALYRTKPALDQPARMTAIPYYLWSNRETGRMAVWIPEFWCN
jgi:DUF1680 family protein